MDKRLYRNLLIVLLAIIFVITGIAVFSLPKPKLVYFDVDGDGKEEEFSLKHDTLTVKAGDTVLWTSEKDWEVEDFLIYDINGDGNTELLVLLWKKGSFGDYTPIWIDKADDNEWTQHMFIYTWDNKWSPLWMSSKLIPEIAEWNMTEDGKIHIITDSGEDTLWQWGSWGIERYK